jgi:aspartate/methionine/tyrosine aminotransferase
VIEYNGMVSVGTPLDEKNNFRMNPDDVSNRITKKTKLLVVNTPQNPTGAVMTKKEVFEMARIAELNNIYLLSDEVYSSITYDKIHHSPTILDQCKERSILLGSLSKIFSMSGWRLGYAVGPKKLIEKMGLLLQTILSCLPAFVQLGGVAALSGDQTFLAERFKELKHRRDLLVNGLNDIPGMSCVLPEGSFYAFPNICGSGMTSDEYSRKLLQDSGVCVLSGNCFGKFGEGYVRLSYGSTTIEMIEKSLHKINNFHEYHR